MIKQIRCSGLSRVMQCPGSLFFTGLPPQETNPAAEEGTAAAEMLDLMMKNSWNGQTHASNGVRFNEDMQFHIPTIHKEIRDRAGINLVYSEADCTWQTRSGIMIKGTCDDSYVDANGWLNVDDLKFGYGIIEPKLNWQLIAYAIGQAIKHGRAFEKIVLRIIQPRPHHEDGPDRTWVISYTELLELKEKIEARCDALAAGVNDLVTGSSCKYCPAAAVCGAANRSFYLGVEVAMGHVQDNIGGIALANELDVVKRAEEMIKLRKDSLTALAVDRVRKGEIIPGYITEESFGDRKWKNNITPEIIKVMTNVDVLQAKMISPAQAEKAGVNKAVVKELVERPFLGMKLVRKDASKVANAIFGKPTQEAK